MIGFSTVGLVEVGLADTPSEVCVLDGMTSIVLLDELQATPAKMIMRERKIKLPRLPGFFSIECLDEGSENFELIRNNFNHND
jgi:hypothetical protein